MRLRLYLIIASLLVLASACVSVDRGRTSDVISEARDFMEEYAEDLSSRDRQAIAARYHRSGAFVIFNGKKRFSSFEEIEASYKESWVGPTAFAWRNLSYEAISLDAVVVIGEFDWTDASGIHAYSYTGLLKRSDGDLRIRLEVETNIEFASSRLLVR